MQEVEKREAVPECRQVWLREARVRQILCAKTVSPKAVAVGKVGRPKSKRCESVF